MNKYQTNPSELLNEYHLEAKRIHRAEQKMAAIRSVLTKEHPKMASTELVALDKYIDLDCPSRYKSALQYVLRNAEITFEPIQ